MRTGLNNKGRKGKVFCERPLHRQQPENYMQNVHVAPSRKNLYRRPCHRLRFLIETDEVYLISSH